MVGFEEQGKGHQSKTQAPPEDEKGTASPLGPLEGSSAPTTTSIVSEMGRTPDVCSLSAEHLHPRTGGRPPGRRVGATPFFQVAPDVQGEGFTALRPRAGSPFPWPPPPHGGVLSCEKREPPLSLC
ncbi:unnamed protein product [Rangifer tarandus platyrhynchus]|uniref:Uncharacterized protein n=1 Tax=Rangifer tarandus platyrhynchus TaxID=3082113 RepID=A0ABN8Z0I3_RANTA|nr:unnamed protein product [Rangifer tarandus platyrhynchus]